MTKPPDTLTEPLEADALSLNAPEMHFLLASLVLPRPIGWISTVSTSGIANLAPFSFFTVASANPPHLVFSSGSATKDTVINARETGEFVANIVDQTLVEEMVGSSAHVAPNVDEFELLKLEKTPSARVKAPRVKRAKAHFECAVRQFVPVGTATLVIGEVLHVHVDASVWSGGRVRAELLKPIARLGGSAYATLGDMFSRPAPTINERG
jgi:flavin reductase (DIM6/NTAB) family NADH-FMN oxidoreductase RutF